MSFVSKTEILKRFGDDFHSGGMDEKCFSKSGASYDMRLGEEVLVTPEKEPRKLEKGQVLNINPGQFAVLTTKEYLKMPKSLLGLITVRFTFKSKGLVNISGFHVDPGFNGHLVFSVYNTGPATVSLREGDRVFSIFFAEIHPEVEYGKEGQQALYQFQKEIPLEIIETFAGARVPSLVALEEKVNKNSTTLKIYGSILTGLIVSVLGTIIAFLLGLR
jgi:dCTP deaminase